MNKGGRSPYDAKCNVAEIGAVNMGEIGAVRKRVALVKIQVRPSEFQ